MKNKLSVSDFNSWAKNKNIQYNDVNADSKFYTLLSTRKDHME